MAEPGEVYWSNRAGQFYQHGHSGAVSYDTGIGFIEYNPREGRYLDVRGHVVPDRVLSHPAVRVRRFVAHDLEGRPFISTTFVDRRVSRAQAAQYDYAGNQQLVVRTVYRTPNGRVDSFYTTGEVGRTPNIGTMEETGVKQAHGELTCGGLVTEGFSPENEVISQEYLIRTIRVQARGG